MISVVNKYFSVIILFNLLHTMKNPYKILGVSKTATKKEIKKAYYKLSLKYHPDKLDGKDEKFKEVVVAYKVLTEHRDAYDNGEMINEKEVWEKWNELDAMKKKYQSSSEEKEDIIAAYIKSKGKMEEIFNAIPFVTLDDEDRIVSIITSAVNNEGVKRYRKFFEEKEVDKKKRRKILEDEEVEAEVAKKDLMEHMKARYHVESKDMEGKNLEDLGLILKDRQKSSWHSMIKGIEERYGSVEDDEVIDFSVKKKKKKKSKKN
eukprot:NODE_128_length_17019_cov_0.764480.p9 type:complete len:262 gc:universal NODE_128_length_17019_cov_0.764480:4941-5726(+)